MIHRFDIHLYFLLTEYDCDIYTGFEVYCCVYMMILSKWVIIILHSVYQYSIHLLTMDLDIVWPVYYSYNTQVNPRLFRYRDSETSRYILSSKEIDVFDINVYYLVLYILMYVFWWHVYCKYFIFILYIVFYRCDWLCVLCYL